LKVFANLLTFLKTIFTSGNKHMTEEIKNDLPIKDEFKPTILNEVLHVGRPVGEKFPISSPFGWRNNPFKPEEKKFHKGIDFSTPIGTPVYAMVDGVCISAGWEDPKDQKKGFGLRVWQESVIDGRTIYFWYGHLSETKIKPVELIKKGQEIGITGNSGSSTGPHLHVQAREKNTGKLFDMVFHA